MKQQASYPFRLKPLALHIAIICANWGNTRLLYSINYHTYKGV